MSLLFHPGQRIATKAIDKVIAKETKKLQTKTEDSQAEIYYDGIYTFGMDTYVTLKVTARRA